MSSSFVLNYRLDLVCFVAASGIVFGLHQKRVKLWQDPAERTRYDLGISLVIAVATILLTETVESLTAAAGGSSADWRLVSARAVILALGAVVLWLFLDRRYFTLALRRELLAREEARQSSQSTTEAATAVNRAKSEFLSVVSHEIRSPLTAVLGFANVLSETRLNETQKRYVDTIVRAGDRLAALINDILDLSKMEEGRIQLDPAPFLPALVVHEVIDSVSDIVTEKDVEIRFLNRFGGPLTIESDPTRFRQLLLNLVSNAAKFTNQGSITIEASWEASAEDPHSGTLTVVVTDTGVGIIPERVTQLSNCFKYPVNAPIRQYGRPGIGLAICHRLVNLMSGRISIRSELGAGTQFVVTLPAPLSRPDSQHGISVDRTDNVPGPARKRLLIVDDEAVNLELLSLLVHKAGYDCDQAINGEEALRLSQARTYAAILLDLEMPAVDGFTTARRIRAAEPAGTRVPIVAVTAITARGTRDKCMEAGMDEYLSKPVYLPALQSTLKAYLEKARADTVA